ncbi:MAG TPA: primase-like DNA-binding domain-containing protein, partial [Flavobacteriales bacterium]|nr:primase-like DNA-binding domain-containing protein [Flavobacteriales bacterium]
TIPEHERDVKLSSKIIETELSGVFNWVLDGLTRLLQQEGFTESQAVNEALQQYRKRSDSVLGFIEDYNLKPSASETKPLMDLYHQYKVHCVDSGSRPCGRNTFSERLRANGYNIERRNSGRVVWVETGDEKENVF